MFIILLAATVVLFVIGVVSAALGSRMKHPIAILTNLVLIGLVFALGWAMNVELGRPSGNGNPALLLIAPAAGLGLALIGQLYMTPLLRRARPLLLSAVLLGLAAHQAAGFELQRIRYRALRERAIRAIEASERDSDAAYFGSIPSGPSDIHMNAHYFHPNTYLLLIGWAAIAAIVLLLIRAGMRKRRPNGTEHEAGKKSG